MREREAQGGTQGGCMGGREPVRICDLTPKLCRYTRIKTKYPKKSANQDQWF